MGPKKETAKIKRKAEKASFTGGGGVGVCVCVAVGCGECKKAEAQVTRSVVLVLVKSEQLFTGGGGLHIVQCLQVCGNVCDWDVVCECEVRQNGWRCVSEKTRGEFECRAAIQVFFGGAAFEPQNCV